MTYQEALMWYQLGINSTLAVVGGPFLLVMLARWAKSFL